MCVCVLDPAALANTYTRARAHTHARTHSLTHTYTHTHTLVTLFQVGQVLSALFGPHDTHLSEGCIDDDVGRGTIK